MDKQGLVNHFKEYFNVGNLSLIVYKNPDEYCLGFTEDVNGGKEKIIYGKRYKYNKNNNYEKILKIILPCFVIFLSSCVFVLSGSFTVSLLYFMFCLIFDFYYKERLKYEC
jgi:predicted membrane-bound dolichyl-phosphate-mannose-protein mannosyltransferase